MIDLSTNYLGLKLKNPVVVSASPLTEKLENFARLEDAGAAAIVMYSLMEEQIEAESENIDNALEYGTNSYAESTSYLPDMQKYHVGPDRYLELLRKGKASVRFPGHRQPERQFARRLDALFASTWNRPAPTRWN